MRGNISLSIFHIKKFEKGPLGAAMPRHLSSANESAVLMEPRFSVSLIKWQGTNYHMLIYDNLQAVTIKGVLMPLFRGGLADDSTLDSSMKKQKALTINS